METSIYYPQTSLERYPPSLEAMAILFAKRLFQPSRLWEVTHPLFQEYLEGEGLSLDGLEALVVYRQRFGEPRLNSVRFFVVPPSLARMRLGGPGQYNWDALMELTMSIPYGSLMPEWRDGLDEDAVVPVQLRMHEPTYSEQVWKADGFEMRMPLGTRLVRERTYRPYLRDRLGKPHGQVAHVGEQVAFYAQHGRPMYAADDGWTPTWRAYNELFTDTFMTNPVIS